RSDGETMARAHEADRSFWAEEPEIGSQEQLGSTADGGAGGGGDDYRRRCHHGGVQAVQRVAQCCSLLRRQIQVGSARESSRAGRSQDYHGVIVAVDGSGDGVYDDRIESVSLLRSIQEKLPDSRFWIIDDDAHSDQTSVCCRRSHAPTVRLHHSKPIGSSR